MVIRLNCIQARIGNAVAPATISLRKYQSKRMSNTGNIIYSSSEKGFGDAATERRSAGAKKRGKRGKVSSRPDPKEQMGKLQEQMDREAVARKYQANLEQVSSTAAVEQNKDSSLATVPEQITNRMLKRILLFSGGPVLLGMLLFPAFYYVKKVQGIDLPVWSVYIIQTGLLGISYGIISSSWDTSREGSLSGWNEFQTNLPMVLDRFRKKDSNS
eukprot:jgi/Picsp_1/2117/NSC_05582-R1_protein